MPYLLDPNDPNNQLQAPPAPQSNGFNPMQAASGFNPMAAGAGIGGGIGEGLGDVIGYFASQGDRDKARSLTDEATGMYRGLNPHITSQAVQSKFATMDPQGREAQLAALAQLKQQYQMGGQDPIAKAQQFQAEAEANRNTRAMNEAVQNRMAQSGQGGGGYALQRENGSDSADRLAGMDSQALAAQYARGTNALGQALTGAGSMRAQDNDAAANQDAISRFNEANRMRAQQGTFDNRYAQAGGINGQAGAYNGYAQQTQRAAGGAGRAIGGTIGAAAGAGF